MPKNNPDKITLDDLKLKLDEINRAARASVKSETSQIYMIGIVIVAAAVGGSYLMGKRRARKLCAPVSTRSL